MSVERPNRYSWESDALRRASEIRFIARHGNDQEVMSLKTPSQEEFPYSSIEELRRHWNHTAEQLLKGIMQLRERVPGRRLDTQYPIVVYNSAFPNRAMR